ncbi:serine/threonine-protein phosphatase 6 regulatory subunit 2 isoform X2 [Bacillus rossius redtenbacheri]|uniref:serine/threonine-protein phosphatase 6 regulatory subunit 2 isoform X2 n=1 Tax=Bacillus rossius redtenbacheri TaxID=93214 RepID=UPI002FDEF352
MFFKFNQNSSAQVEAVLNKEDVTLRDLMDEEDTLQECRVQNKKLIDFLVRPEVMEELVTLVTAAPSSDAEERLRYKYPNLACELLTCDVPAISERLAGEPRLLDRLHGFLEQERPLDPLLASFWSKVVGALVSRNGDQVLEFFKSKANFVSLLLKHLGTSAIMDATLKLITQVEGVDIRQNVLNWLDSQTVVQSLVSLLRPCVDTERQSNAAQLLCDIVRLGRDGLHGCTERRDPDPVLAQVENPDTVRTLLENVLGGSDKSEASIVGGISVLLALLDCSRQSACVAETSVYGAASLGTDGAAGEERPRSRVVVSTTAAVVPWVARLHDLLLNPPVKAPVRTTVGVLDPPLGNARLQVARLVAALVSIDDADVNKELVRLGTVEVLLDLFFNYTWNNFLHFQVEQCLAFALNAQLKPASDAQHSILLESIFIRCKLMQRILEAWDGNEDNECSIQGRRKGYMGHLANIANHVAQAAEKEPLGSAIRDWVTKDTVAAWEAFMANALAETNRTNDILLAGVHPAQFTSEDAQDFRDIPFPQNPALQQVFSEYQINQPSPQFIENYGYHNDEFSDGDEISSGLATDRLASMTFTVSEEELDQQAQVFRQVCRGKLGASDAWGHGRRWDDAADSSSDEDEPPGPDREEQADADAWAGGEAAEGAGDAPVAVDAGNPWASSAPPAAGFPAGWADFDSAGFADFEANFDPEGSCDLDDQATAPSAPSAPALLDQDDATCTNGNSPEEAAHGGLEQERVAAVGDDAPSETTLAEGTDSCAADANQNQPAGADSQLLDNYRFLSTQGMISENSAGESGGSDESGGNGKGKDVEAELNGPVVTPELSGATDDDTASSKSKAEEGGAETGPPPVTPNGPV